MRTGGPGTRHQCCSTRSRPAVVVRRLDDFNAQGLATTAWAYAVSDFAPTAALFDERFAQRCDALASEFITKSLSQLHRWRVWRDGENHSAEAQPLPSPALLARCRLAFTTIQAN